MVTLNVRGTGLELGLWGRNLANKHHRAQSVDFGYLIDSIPGERRVFGVSVRYVVGSH